MSVITIADTEIPPGNRTIIQLPVANLYTHRQMDLPIHVINGKQPGPRLFVCAAVHGDELNGVEIIRRLLKQKSLNNLRGSLIAIPVVNIFGLILHSRYLPDRRDLNRSFPGSKRGPLASRLANILTQTIISQCTHGIDLHTGAIHRHNLPQIRADLDDAQTNDLAHAFGVPVLINANTRDGSLRETATNLGVKMLMYEAGEALRLDDLSINAGVRGILNVMRKLEMIKASKRRDNASEPFIARSSQWIRSPYSGIFRSKKRLGEYVDEGELLGKIFDPTDIFGEVEYPVPAARSGVIIGKTNLPLVNEGDALYHIASFEHGNEVALEVESFQQDMEPD
ncbi:MAG: succinylglutamate desuccinylase/aspartoacylase family protein [Gammaproteobacteria bacterium]